MVQRMRRRIEINGTAYDYELRKNDCDRTLVTDGSEATITSIDQGATTLRLAVDDAQRSFSFVRIGGELWLTDGRAYYRARQLSTTQERAATEPQGRIVSHMPGRILAVNVVPEQRVHAGEALIVLEAMKMEHTLSSPATGAVKTVPVSVDQRVMPGDLLIELELDGA